MYKTTRNLAVLGAGLSISAVVGWLLLRENKRSKEPSDVVIRSQSRRANGDEIREIVLPLDALSREEYPPQPGEIAITADDLTEIKDIGPRFAQALQAIGITRFVQLAQETPESLAEKMSGLVTVRPQRIRDNDWIGQAAEKAKG